MADAEVDETPEQVEEPSTATGEEAPAASTSAKEKVKKPLKPDETELKLQTGLLNDEIQKAKTRIEQIKEEIGNKSTNRQKGSEEQQRVKGQLSELRGHFQAELVRILFLQVTSLDALFLSSCNPVSNRLRRRCAFVDID